MLTRASDVYALGLVLAQLVIDRKPEGAPEQALFAIPSADLRAVIRMATAPLEARYTSVEAMAEDLRRIHARQPLEARKQELARPVARLLYRARLFCGRNWAVLGSILGLLVLLST